MTTRAIVGSLLMLFACPLLCLGHLVTAEISVDSLEAASSGARQAGDRVSSMAVGISVIFGLFGFYALVRASRNAKVSSRLDGGDS